MENVKTIVENLTPEFVQNVIALQKKVYVGKNRNNTFADFKYRSLDDIFRRRSRLRRNWGFYCL